jgi:hypothetical protein
MQSACAILSSVAYPALQYFSTLSYKRQDFRKRKLHEHKTRALLLSITFGETFLVLRRTERDVTENISWHLRKAPFFSCPILMKLEFADFRKILDYQI